MSSRNRKVYQMGDMSVREFYSAPTRYLAQAVNKESEFEKPYLDDDRGKMHMDLPWPDWPPFPPVSPWPPMPDLPSPAPGGNWCILSVLGALDCDGSLRFWVMVCGVSEAGDLCNPGQLSRWKVEGDAAEVTSDFLGIEVEIDEEAALQRPDKIAWIKACFTDPAGNTCCEEAEVTCKVCPPEISISWNVGGSSQTIGQGNGGFATAGVKVSNGLGPYQWSVAGQGFSMLHAETAGVSNTLQADATACGVATITVTDYCEESTSGEVRCTADSHWVSKETCYACPSPWDSLCNQNSCATCSAIDDIVDGKKKWIIIGNVEYNTTNGGCPPVWSASFPCDGSGCVNPPTCGAPGGCGSGSECGADRACSASQSFYQEWECV